MKQRKQTINVSILNKKINQLKYILDSKKEKATLFEIISTVINVLLAFISAVLAFLTFNQQQEIKGMSDLLHKQDTLIMKQNTLVSSISELVIQNNSMIAELQYSQKLTKSEIDAINNQTTVNRYSSKPLVNIDGSLYIQKITSDTSSKEYEISVGYKNNGLRIASDVKTTNIWLTIINKKVQLSGKTLYTFPNNFYPGEIDHVKIPIIISTRDLLKFYNLYFISIVEYKDPLTNNIEKETTIARQFKKSDNWISYTFITGEERKLLEQYIKLNNL